MSAVETVGLPLTEERGRLAADVREARKLETAAEAALRAANRAPQRARAALEDAAVAGASDDDLAALHAAVRDAEARIERVPQLDGLPPTEVDVVARGRLRAAKAAREAAEEALASFEADRYDALVAELAPGAVEATAALAAALVAADRAIRAYQDVHGVVTVLGQRTGRGGEYDLPVDLLGLPLRQGVANAAATIGADLRGWVPLPGAALPDDVLGVPGV